MRSWPVVGSCPTAASAKPNIIDAIVFMGGSLPMPTKLQNVSNWTAKSSAGPNASAKSATIGARKVRMTTAKKRSEEHTSELQSLMRISYAVFCLKKQNHQQTATRQLDYRSRHNRSTTL